MYYPGTLDLLSKTTGPSQSHSFCFQKRSPTWWPRIHLLEHPANLWWSPWGSGRPLPNPWCCSDDRPSIFIFILVYHLSKAFDCIDGHLIWDHIYKKCRHVASWIRKENIFETTQISSYSAEDYITSLSLCSTARSISALSWGGRPGISTLKKPRTMVEVASSSLRPRDIK